jgi:hypothetical protein
MHGMERNHDCWTSIPQTLQTQKKAKIKMPELRCEDMAVDCRRPGKKVARVIDKKTAPLPSNREQTQ